MERKSEYIGFASEILFPKEKDKELVAGAVSLVNHFGQLGLMLPVTEEHYLGLAAKSTLCVACVAKSGFGEVIGTVAYTQFYEKGIWEFGGWAVSEDFQHQGLGKYLLGVLFWHKPHDETIAFGNKNSGPILESLGAQVIANHSLLPPKAFELCATCPRKPAVGCCDTIYDLKPIVLAVKSAKAMVTQAANRCYR